MPLTTHLDSSLEYLVGGGGDAADCWVDHGHSATLSLLRNAGPG